MRLRLSRRDLVSVGTLALAWIGLWGGWISHHTASLTQNALYLAEWSTFLPEVRFGTLAQEPEWLRLAVSLTSVALAVGASALEQKWLRVVIRIFCLLPPVVMLPPYPELLKLWNSESYGLRFIVAAVGLAGSIAGFLTDLLPGQLRRVLVIVLSASAAGLGIWSYLVMRRPFEVCYASPIVPGRGLLLFVIGLALTIVLQVSVLINHLRGDRLASRTSATI